MDIIVTAVSMAEGVFTLSLTAMELLFGAIVQLFNVSLYLVPSLFGVLYYLVSNAFHVLLFVGLFLVASVLTVVDVFFKIYQLCWEWVSLVYRIPLNVASLLLEFMDQFGVRSEKTPKMQPARMNYFLDTLLFMWKNLMGLSICVVLLITLYMLIRIFISRCTKRRSSRQLQPRTRNTTPSLESRQLQPRTRATRNTTPSINQQSTIETSTSATTIRQRRVSGDSTSTVPSPASSYTTDRSDFGLKDEVSKLNAQLVEEKDKHNCVVCFENKREVLLKPCNHFCLCVSCLPKLKRCPICNQTISSSEKIFHV